MTQAQTAPDPGSTPGSDSAAAPEDIIVKGLGLTKIFKDFWLRDKVRAVAVKAWEDYSKQSPLAKEAYEAHVKFMKMYGLLK